MMVVVIGERVAEHSCCCDSGNCKAWVHGLNGSACGIICGHAAHACADGEQDHGKAAQTMEYGFRFHTPIDAREKRIFNRFSKISGLVSPGIKRAGSCRSP
jgi:hypothetical protein